MAFTVTPTSGEAPYILAVELADDEFLDGVHYMATVAHTTSSGSCPLKGTVSKFSAVAVNGFITNGTYEAMGDVPPGSCRTYTMEIIRLKDNAVIASSNVYVDNV